MESGENNTLTLMGRVPRMREHGVPKIKKTFQLNVLSKLWRKTWGRIFGINWHGARSG